MRKRAMIISFICILLAIVIVMAAVAFSGRKPYKNLDSSQVVSAMVQITPPDKTEMLSFADNAQETTFQATVIEVTDSSILVEPVDGSPELASSDQFSVPNTEKLALQTGDMVEIAYNGEILESYPAQLGEVYKITLLEQTKADTSMEKVMP